MAQNKEVDTSKNKCPRRITRVYKGMKERCNNENHAYYHIYGGKGIEVLVNRHEFVEWYLERVTDDMIRPNVDRLDPNGHYEFSNMQVISAKENSQKMLEQNPRWDIKLDNMKRANEKRSKGVTIDGIRYDSIRQASRETNFAQKGISNAYKKHGDIDFVLISRGTRRFIEVKSE